MSILNTTPRLPVRHTARRLLSNTQVAVGVIALLLLGYAGYRNPHALLEGLVIACVGFYAVFVTFKLTLFVAAHFYKPAKAKTTLHSIDSLPVYTIFVPLYREAKVLPALVESIGRLDWPKDRLQVLLLLEQDDEETLDAAADAGLPDYFEIMVMPQFGPKTKPKACNMGLSMARGKYCVIYDAEDRPDPDQLLKAYAALMATPDDVVCVQARLEFWNRTSSWVSRFYWAEYVVHFDWVLRGLSKLKLVPPLGGTSNHFITERLREVAIKEEALPKGARGIGGWDPWNVTEDAELAGALARHGYRVEIIDSVTREEAVIKLRNADKQRRRWLKGYAQTGLVYTRNPIRDMRRMGVRNFCSYNLLMLGTPLSLLLNPIFWGLTIAYFLTRSQYIESLFPGPVFYLGLAVMLIGNFMFFYQLILASLHRDGYGNVKYMFLFPVWWAFTSWSAYAMLFELMRKKSRSHWHKTEHGHDHGREAIFGLEPAAATSQSTARSGTTY